MTTKRENILARIKTVLDSTSGVSSRVYRSRAVALQRNELPAVVIEPLSDSPEQNTVLPTLDWTLRVRITIIQKGSTSTSPDSAADSIIESMHSLLMADLTLNGNAIDVQPDDVNFDIVDADQPSIVVQNEYIIRYRSEIDDLTQ